MSVHYKVCFSTSKFVTLWTVAHQAPLCMGFSRQKYWSGLPCPPPGDLLNSEIEPLSSASPAMQVDFLPVEPPEKAKHLGKLNNRKWKCIHSVVSDSLQPHGLYPTRLLCPWNSPGKNTEVGCHALLQGIFQTRGSHPGLLHCRKILYQLTILNNTERAKIS